MSSNNVPKNPRSDQNDPTELQRRPRQAISEWTNDEGDLLRDTVQSIRPQPQTRANLPIHVTPAKTPLPGQGQWNTVLPQEPSKILNQAQLQALKEKLPELGDLDWSTPKLKEQMYTDKGKKFVVIERRMEYGMRYPLPEVLIDILNEFKMVTLARICEDIGLLLTRNLFKYLRTLVKASNHPCVFFKEIQGLETSFEKTLLSEHLQDHMDMARPLEWEPTVAMESRF
ncbi:hypothetical protein M5689_019061 [Euphorbia peplus]|nr:hypothetical protein M5689_019061 [Euphorbia peplus]